MARPHRCNAGARRRARVPTPVAMRRPPPRSENQRADTKLDGCAAAARLTGRADDGKLKVGIMYHGQFHSSRIRSIARKNYEIVSHWLLARSHIGALVGEIADECVHRGKLGAADQRRRLAFLRDQAGIDEALAVMRQRGSRDVQLFLDTPDWEARFARSHEDAINVEACRVAEGFKLSGCFFEFHGNRLGCRKHGRQGYFENSRN